MRYVFMVSLFLWVFDCGGQNFANNLSDAAINIIDPEIIYDPNYYSIDYPGGDIAEGFGVCTDVIIRAYRALGTDLQVMVHEDMKNNFSEYPTKYGLRNTDRNIDHRRVPNLMKFFERNGESIPVSLNQEDYFPGDIVTWDLGGGITHIGIVVSVKSPGHNRYQIVHNIGGGQVMEDCLMSYKITGHYRYYPE